MKWMTSISIPIDVESDVEEQISCAFIKSLGEMTSEEETYVGRKIERTTKGLLASKRKWIKELGEKAHLLWNLYNNDRFFRDISDRNAIRRSILAALFYLCNPFDVIPDHVPGIGFADDALVINFCIHRLKSHPELKPLLKLSRRRAQNNK